MSEENRPDSSRSDVTVRAYVPPQGIGQVIPALVCLATFLVFGYRSNLAGRGWVGDAWGLRQEFPGLWSGMWKAQPWIFWPMLVGHSFQTWHMDRTRLQKYGVPRFSALWWKWTVSTFVEGFKNFERLDDLVKQERRGKQE